MGVLAQMRPRIASARLANSIQPPTSSVRLHALAPGQCVAAAAASYIGAYLLPSEDPDPGTTCHSLALQGW